MTRRGALLNALDVVIPVALLAAVFVGAYLFGYDLPEALRDAWAGLAQWISR